MTGIRAGTAVLCYSLFLVLFFHLLRKKMNRWLAVLASASLALPFALLPYGFNLSAYLEETEELLGVFREDLLKITLGGIIGGVGLVACYLSLPRKYLQFWKIFGAPLVYQHRYIAVGQIVVGLLTLYFLWVGAELALLFLFTVLAAFLVEEYSRYKPLSQPVVSEIAGRWVEPATIGRWRIYLPGFFFLFGCISAVVFCPDYSAHIILILTLSDTAACFADDLVGRHPLPYNRGKSIEGLACFFLVTLAILFLLGVKYPGLLVIALAVSMVESLSPSGTDNLSVPLSSLLLFRLAG